MHAKKPISTTSLLRNGVVMAVSKKDIRGGAELILLFLSPLSLIHIHTLSLARKHCFPSLFSLSLFHPSPSSWSRLLTFYTVAIGVKIRAKEFNTRRQPEKVSRGTLTQACFSSLFIDSLEVRFAGYRLFFHSFSLWLSFLLPALFFSSPKYAPCVRKTKL